MADDNSVNSVVENPLHIDIILHHIFGFLSDADVSSAGFVCKQWGTVASLVRCHKRHDNKRSLRVLSLDDVLATPLYTLANQVGLHVGEYTMAEAEEIPWMLARAEYLTSAEIQSLSEVDDAGSASAIEMKCPIDLVIGQGPVENTLAAYAVVADCHLKFLLPVPFLLCFNFSEIRIEDMNLKLPEHSRLEDRQCADRSPLWRKYQLLSTVPEVDELRLEELVSEMAELPRTLSEAVHTEENGTTASVESIEVRGEVEEFWNELVIQRPIEGDTEIYANEVDKIFGFESSYTDILDLQPPERYALYRTGVPVQEMRVLLAPLLDYFSHHAP